MSDTNAHSLQVNDLPYDGEMSDTENAFDGDEPTGSPVVDNDEWEEWLNLKEHGCNSPMRQVIAMDEEDRRAFMTKHFAVFHNLTTREWMEAKCSQGEVEESGISVRFDVDSVALAGTHLSDLLGAIDVDGAVFKFHSPDTNKFNKSSRFVVGGNKYFRPKSRLGYEQDSVPLTHFRNIEICVIQLNTLNLELHVNWHMINCDTLGPRAEERHALDN